MDSEIKSVIEILKKILANLNADELSEIHRLQSKKDQHYINNK